MDLAVRGKLATKGTESILGAFVLQRCQVHSCITSIAKERVPNASVPGAVALGSDSPLARAWSRYTHSGSTRALPRPVLMRVACDASVFINHVTRP